jgi:hypothetical protein
MTTPDLTEILEAIEIVDTIPDAFGRIRALIEISQFFGVEFRHIIHIHYLYLEKDDVSVLA